MMSYFFFNFFGLLFWRVNKPPDYSAKWVVMRATLLLLLRATPQIAEN